MSFGNRPGEREDADKSDLDALLQKIYDARGYDFREYKRASVERRITKRLFDHHLKTYDEYAALLDKDPGEYAKLFDTLLINVSEFFRDTAAWDALDSVVLPNILANKSRGEPISAWSAGCSTGEEPYTLAILLAEKLGAAISDHDIRIFATDIDDTALAEARLGIYPGDKVKNVKKELLDQYFIKEHGRYKVNDRIRRMVNFQRLDMILDSPATGFDLVICRNVLIYFKIDLQSRILTKFYHVLNDNGYAFFGKSESVLPGSTKFTQIDKKWRLFKKIPPNPSA